MFVMWITSKYGSFDVARKPAKNSIIALLRTYPASGVNVFVGVRAGVGNAGHEYCGVGADKTTAVQFCASWVRQVWAVWVWAGFKLTRGEIRHGKLVCEHFRVGAG